MNKETKVRASTEWDLKQRGREYRLRSQTDGSNEVVNPSISPQRSIRGISMKKPLTEYMWIEETSTSIFSMHSMNGMESMLNKLNNKKSNINNKQQETQGEWIEARETISHRVMWYNTISHRLIFDT
eukprot:122787_1